MVTSELAGVPIRGILLADVGADLLQLDLDGRYGITTGPEVLPGKVSFFALQASNRDGALSFQEPDHGGHRVLGRNSNAHVHMVRHEMPFQNLALLLPSQRMKDRTQLPADLAKDGLPPPLGHEYDVVLCSPISNGIGSDKAQTLHPLLGVHQGTGRGFYSRNGQTFSSRTGRTSGLPIELVIVSG
jgi:hypothetical protein